MKYTCPAVIRSTGVEELYDRKDSSTPYAFLRSRYDNRCAVLTDVRNGTASRRASLSAAKHSARSDDRESAERVRGYSVLFIYLQSVIPLHPQRGERLISARDALYPPWFDVMD